MAEGSTTPDLVELSRQSVEAMNRRDLGASMSYFAADAVWDASRIGIGTFAGVEAIRSFLEDWLGTFRELTIRQMEIVDAGNGVILALCVLTGRAAGAETHLRWAAVNQFVDGSCVRVEAYLDIDEARAAAKRLAQERG